MSGFIICILHQILLGRWTRRG